MSVKRRQTLPVKRLDDYDACMRNLKILMSCIYFHSFGDELDDILNAEFNRLAKPPTDYSKPTYLAYNEGPRKISIIVFYDVLTMRYVPKEVHFHIRISGNAFKMSAVLNIDYDRLSVGIDKTFVLYDLKTRCPTYRMTITIASDYDMETDRFINGLTLTPIDN